MMGKPALETAYQNISAYSAAALWIAYGVAIGITILLITIGTWAVAAAGSSYSGKFSTMLRLAFNVHLSEYLELRDTGGKDPLPDRLENTIVVFPSRNAKGAEVNASLLGNREEQPSGLDKVCGKEVLFFVRSTRDEVNSGEVTSVAFLRDGTQLASASKDCTVKVWYSATGHCLRTLGGHRSSVYSVAFSGNGKQLASA
ncbi:het-r protein [Colletotrichum incanum]|nr:het-r protein [Colletotrichum incanum]